ncbi:MAG: hypothetical protein RSE60_02810 [Erysipelotrichaceae bacterium]
MQTTSRVRNKTFAFHVTEEERNEIEARVLISGLSKTDYFIKTFLEQDIQLKVGKFHSDRLGVEIGKLNKNLSSINVEDNELKSVINETRSLLNQLLPFFEQLDKNTLIISEKDFSTVNEDTFTDVEIY